MEAFYAARTAFAPCRIWYGKRFREGQGEEVISVW
ncbi:hypothetical protein ABAC402_03245 [Asticcacaulis sp. AC402]|nr:hypothetical protein ABAC402_03245 [Asticcacaulis sp. AC402]